MQSNLSRRLRTLGRYLAMVVLCNLLCGTLATAQSHGKPAEARAVKMFYLKNTSAKQASNLLLAVLPEMALAIDERTNAIVVSGTKEALASAEALLGELDASPKAAVAADTSQPTAREMQIRIYWLANGLAPVEGPGTSSGSQPVVDLQPVVKELENIGIKDLQIVNQTVLRFLDRPFEAEGSAMLRVGEGSAVREYPCTFEISGSSTAAQGGRIQLGIRVKTVSPDREKKGHTVKEPLVSVNTEVATPPGHFAVLGVSSSHTLTSAFVIQVTPVKSSTGEKPVEAPEGQRR